MSVKTTVPAALQDFFRQHPQLALAFSGGCDSAYLLYAAMECGVKLGVYYVHSEFQPGFELEDARRLADELGQDLTILDVHVLEDDAVRSNPGNRCYHCKRRIFGAILDRAKLDGFDVIIDGTNASDDAGDRPGMRALGEMKVLSPLRLCGIHKDQVRDLSRRAGLFTWNKPAYACLATRVPAGMPIETAMLAGIERAEMTLARMGFSDFRVRLMQTGARLELLEEQMPLLLEKRRDVLDLLRQDFAQIVLDLQPRKGIEI